MVKTGGDRNPWRAAIRPARGLAVPFAWGAGAVGAGAILVSGLPGLALSGIVPSLGAFAALAGILIVGVALAPGRYGLPPDGFGPDGFGAANRVTLGRAVLVAVIAGLLAAPAPAWYLASWLVVVLGGIALVLDGLDGRVARRTGQSSVFGARFDMETDALLALILAALVWRYDKAGGWVMASGLARYGLGLAGLVLPPLRQPLPPRRRRQTVCVLLVASLLVCLVPAVTPPWSGILAALATGLTLWSFQVDIVWLWQQQVWGRPWGARAASGSRSE